MAKSTFLVALSILFLSCDISENQPVHGSMDVSIAADSCEVSAHDVDLPYLSYDPCGEIYYVRIQDQVGDPFSANIVELQIPGDIASSLSEKPNQTVEINSSNTSIRVSFLPAGFCPDLYQPLVANSGSITFKNFPKDDKGTISFDFTFSLYDARQQEEVGTLSGSITATISKSYPYSSVPVCPEEIEHPPDITR